MRNETIEAVKDDYKRGRLQALQDLIEQLDQTCSRIRAGFQDVPKGESVEVLYVRIQNAVTRERLQGVIEATQVAVDMFASEAKAHDKERADEPGTG